MDKRIVRTRLAVFNAVFELSTEKDLDKITVVELCDRAGINKSTFYLHYSSINDCFQKCFDFFMSRILEFGKDMDYTRMSLAPEATVKKILDAVEDNLIYVERFRNSMIYDSAIKAVKEKFIAEICSANKINLKDNYHEVAKITFLVGGCTDIIMMLSPNFNRAEVEKIMVNVIKRK
ncbi:MAG: TetR/AcrR family transcriptional regulator [Eubacterium sp.]|nr:TetR/AcrR family transcriptional regulator [Eubacterium sp.]MBR7073291.1 TetR/AcrR family transcriptional regulator [Eubacterium sp.]